jgi:nucleotide-binding universal stress UspA family protein
MKRIVVGYDGSKEADLALTRAAEVAEAFSARLVVVSVTSSALAPALTPSVPEPMAFPRLAPAPIPGELAPAAPLEPQRPSVVDELRERQLERARSRLRGGAVDAEYTAAVGEPAERVLEAAERMEADLIVVGAHEHRFLRDLLGRSLDEKVVRHADRDVLVVH